MDTWTYALRVAAIGITGVFSGLVMLTVGIKIMTYCFRRLAEKKKGN